MTENLPATIEAYGDELDQLDEAKRLIARAIADEDADALKRIRDRSSAVEMHATRTSARALADDAGEIKVRAERGLAQLDVQAAPRGRPVESSQGSDLSAPLAGFRPDTRAAIRKLAGFDDAEFDERIAAARTDEIAGLSTSRILKARDMGVHYSSATDQWATPQDLFDELHEEFRFTLDVCAGEDNAKCKRFFSEADDGLAQRWRGRCWMNPPYGGEIGKWVAKAHEAGDAGATVVCLLPARLDTAWAWEHCRHSEVRLIRGRLKFGGAETSAPFPSMLAIFGREPAVVWWDR